MIKLKQKTTFNAEFFSSTTGALSVSGYNVLFSRDNSDCWIVAGRGNTYMARVALKSGKEVLARIERARDQQFC